MPVNGPLWPHNSVAQACFQPSWVSVITTWERIYYSQHTELPLKIPLQLKHENSVFGPVCQTLLILKMRLLRSWNLSFWNDAHRPHKEPVPAATGQEVTSPSQRQTTMHAHTLEINNHWWSHRACFWSVGEIQSTQTEPSPAHGGHANSTQKGPGRDSNQEPLCCEATELTTTPLCSFACK